MSITSTIQVTEVLWTLFGLIGLYAAQANVRDAQRYVRAVELLNGGNLAGYDVMRTIAAGHLRSEAMRVLVYLAMVGMGGAAMLVPPANPATPVTPVTVAITVGLFLIVATLVVDSFLDKRQRVLMTAVSKPTASERRLTARVAELERKEREHENGEHEAPRP